MPTKIAQNLKWYDRYSYAIINTAETFFYNLGYKIALKPWLTIGLVWFAVFVASLGFFRFSHEKNPLKLWVPQDSKFVKDTNWLLHKFQNAYRIESLLVTAPDVLTPEVFQELYEIDMKLRQATTPHGIQWNDVCFKIPNVGFLLNLIPDSYKGNNTGLFDFNANLHPNATCLLLEMFDKVCYEKNLLELWQYKKRRIDALTKEDILNKINANKINLFGVTQNYENMLSEIKRNKSEHIVSASAIYIQWMTYVNFSAIDMDKSGNEIGTADWATEEALAWEKIFLKTLESISKHTKHIKLYYMSSRSFGDVSGATMLQDIPILALGAFIMVIYVQLVISKFNCIEMRVMLASFGLLTVVMAYIASCGICALIGISFGPVHTSLPFLLMSLGVDDMFVIVAAWNNLPAGQNSLSVPERIGFTLKHAGVSITITSFTDVIAFVIGASTILPSLESYCIYAGLGVLVTFVFVVTFFIACFTLDQKRLELNRNGILPCCKHKNLKRNNCSQSNFSNKVFEVIYSKVIFTWPGKMLVILVTLICLGVSIESSLKLEQKFDPLWFIPKYTYLGQFVEKINHFYPAMGMDAGVYVGTVNYTHEFINIMNLANKLKHSTDIINNVNSWVDPFRNYVFKEIKKDMYETVLSETEFNLYLSKFLFSFQGARFQANFQFKEKLKCGLPVPNITISRFDFALNPFPGPREKIPAMHRLFEIAENNNFTTGEKHAVAWSKIFATWVTDELIFGEVVRNLLLALICVMGCTLILILNLQICFWIFICVLLTIVCVCGFMQRWNLTIDVVSCVALELAIGLCVDYAAHIGHTFLTMQKGSREERAIRTVTSIGSAVFYGGLSTLIGVIMLGCSEAYAFQSFFKIFLLVVIFGLFHGLVLLPVILSWFGPEPYHTHEAIQQDDNEAL